VNRVHTRSLSESRLLFPSISAAGVVIGALLLWAPEALRSPGELILSLGIPYLNLGF
jgi:hypothetical protein